MYLKSLFIENNGPLRHLALDLPFHEDGKPKPVVLVGGNGSGKTNLLSCIADALVEAAARYYRDVTTQHPSAGRHWLRWVGAPTVSVGTNHAFTAMSFSHDDSPYYFTEKVGTVIANDAKPRVPENLHRAINWPEEGATKKFEVQPQKAEKIFRNGVYVYFPYGRSELPHWLNNEAIRTTQLEWLDNINNVLGKPLVVERALDEFERWLIPLLVEKRGDVDIVVAEDGSRTMQVVGNPMLPLATSQSWGAINSVLRVILENDQARVIWLGRHNDRKIGVAMDNEGNVVLGSLNALSAGQATLLNIFGTILRYGDVSTPIVPANLTGICLIDEIDAHMHVHLQHKVLPELISMFPSIQFIVSSHSPLFALGMEQKFGEQGTVFIELPNGNAITPEAFSEFGKALEVMRETQAFTETIEKAVKDQEKPLVLMEGETDPIYCKTAAELLGRQRILDEIDIEWVGAKDPKNGQGRHTGSSGLKATYATLNANPAFLTKPVLLLFDRDTGREHSDEDKLFQRTVPGEAQNTIIPDGIESLLSSEEIFTDEMYDTSQDTKRNGEIVNRKTPNKMRICRNVCEYRRNPADFAAFGPLLDMLEELLLSEPDDEQTAASDDSSPA